MKKGLAKLLYLIAPNQKHIVNTNNLNNLVNKIPCGYSQYFRPTTGELHVLNEMAQYPIGEDKLDQSVIFPFSNPGKIKTNNTFSQLLFNLGSNLNYLDLQQAMEWVRRQDIDQLKKNKRNLDLLQRYVRQTLNEREYEGYVEEAAVELIKSISQAKQKINSFV